MDDVTQQRRAEIVCLCYLLLTLVLAGVVFVISVLTQSLAVQVEALHLLGGAGIWLILLLVYHQRKLVAIETLESEALQQERQRTGAQLFEADAEQLLLMRRRLGWMYRWVLGAATFLLAGWHLIGLVPIGQWQFGRDVWKGLWPTITGESVSMAFLGGVAFVAFLLSRYTSGMARQPAWGMLRAGSSYLFGNSLACVALLIVLGFSNADNPIPERICAYGIVVLMLVIGAEFLLNFVLDLYRPRQPDEEPRPAFDSRLLGLFSEPGGIARSIAEAANYQFGFEVSRTWFYQLLQKAIVPLLVFAVGTQVLMSSFVIVEPGWAAVVERFGKPLQVSGDTVKALEPGIYLKYPWPLDRAYKFRVEEIQEVLVGLTNDQTEEQEPQTGVVLWTQKRHGPGPEWNFLVATRSKDMGGSKEAAPAGQPTTQPEGDRPVGKSVPVSILRTVMVVHYKVNDLYRYAYGKDGHGYENVASALKGIVWRELTQYMASVDLEQIMGRDRKEATEALQEMIATRVKEENLGIEIVHAGFRGIHPASEVAKEFEGVVAAEQKKEASRQQGLRHQNEVLTRVAGSRALAEQLYEAIGAVEKLERKQPGNRNAIENAQAHVEDLLVGKSGSRRGALGEAAEIINKARAKTYTLVSTAQSQLHQLEQERVSFASAPAYYRRRRRLQAHSEAIRDLPKYVLSFIPEKRPFIRIEQQEDELLRFQSFEEEPAAK